MIRFVDRDEEIEILKKAAAMNDAQLVVLYGRRRVGKTRLILEFLKDKNGIFYIAEDVNESVQIKEFKEKIAHYFDDNFLRKVEIRRWNELFEYLKKTIPKDERIYIVIDEFSYLVKNSPDIVSALQIFWDTFASKTRLFILLSGSLIGLMSEKVLSHSSPLYGRRTRDILLSPLSFRYSAEFINMNFEDQLKVYMAIGGVPEYLIKASQYSNFTEFLRNEFLNKYGYFYREPYFLLSQEFKEIKTYFAILNAIAYGNTHAVEIANFVGIKAREIYPYLENLLRLGFVRRIIPVVGNKRRGVYLISDPLLDFWFNLVYERRDYIERGNATIDDNSLRQYFGKRFEIIVRDEFFPQIFGNELKVGKWWHRGDEIDIVAYNENRGEIWFGECKWKEDVDAEKILREIRRNAEKIPWREGERNERYVIFAKSFRRKVDGCRCIDINDLSAIYQSN